MSMVIDIHKKGGIRPNFDVYIGRKTRNTEFIKNSKWHNPRLTLEEYELYIRNGIEETPEYFDLEELKGKILGCWCITTRDIEPLKCHGQVLMKLLKEMSEKCCSTCTMYGLICIRAFDDRGTVCNLYNSRPRCLICNSMLLIDQKVHYSKYTYCPKCKTYINLTED